MPLPSKKDGEDRNKFMSRCMSDPTMGKEYPDNKQRVAVCISKATEDMDYIEAAMIADLSASGVTIIAS